MRARSRHSFCITLKQFNCKRLTFKMNSPIKRLPKDAFDLQASRARRATVAPTVFRTLDTLARAPLGAARRRGALSSRPAIRSVCRALSPSLFIHFNQISIHRSLSLSLSFRFTVPSNGLSFAHIVRAPLVLHSQPRKISSLFFSCDAPCGIIICINCSSKNQRAK